MTRRSKSGGDRRATEAVRPRSPAIRSAPVLRPITVKDLRTGGLRHAERGPRRCADSFMEARWPKDFRRRPGRRGGTEAGSHHDPLHKDMSLHAVQKRTNFQSAASGPFWTRLAAISPLNPLARSLSRDLGSSPVPGRFTSPSPNRVTLAFNRSRMTPLSAPRRRPFPGRREAKCGMPSIRFLHGGWLHVGMNWLWFVAFGSPVARRFGAPRFLFARPGRRRCTTSPT